MFTTKAMTSVLVLLGLVGASNASNSRLTRLDVNVNKLASKFGYDEAFVRESYQKCTAIAQHDQNELARLFPDQVSANRKIIDDSDLLDQQDICGVYGRYSFSVKREMGREVISPLRFACRHGYIESAEWLLQHGANASEVALFKDAINDRSSDVAKWLFEHGAQLSAQQISDLQDEVAKELEFLSIRPIYKRDEQKKILEEIRDLLNGRV